MRLSHVLSRLSEFVQDDQGGLSSMRLSALGWSALLAIVFAHASVAGTQMSFELWLLGFTFTAALHGFKGFQKFAERGLPAPAVQVSKSDVEVQR